MCNLYRMTKNKAEVAAWFGAVDSLGGANFVDEVFPGYPGLVVAEGELRSMVWGFPFAQTSKKTGEPLKPRPVNNARTDKLDGFFWRQSFEQRRCLILLTAWAEAEGPAGSKTRSWMSLPGGELFAAAGVWRQSNEWGAVYSMVMTDAEGPAAAVHSRMPVVLASEDHGVWTTGAPEQARALCSAWRGDLMIERSGEPWSGRGQVALL
jgi:putative SOS response-associated peptidase YedK